MRRLLTLLASVLAASASACAPPPAFEGSASSPAGANDRGGVDDASADQYAIGTKLVTTAGANLRSEASATSDLVRVLAKGTVVVTIHRKTPEGSFYNVRAGGDEGWVHRKYLKRAEGASRTPKAETEDLPATNPDGSAITVPPPPGTFTPPGAVCSQRKLRFSADDLPAVPAAGGGLVWGGNATGGGDVLDPPYAADFLQAAERAHQAHALVFAYLEGPCGDTGGVDDGETTRCADLHRSFNDQFAPGTPDTALARWKPFTMRQLRESGRLKVDFCEIDNLDNNVTVPLIPLLREIKGLFDSQQVACQLVLKNVTVEDIDAIRAQVAPTPADAAFLAPFHIFEADDESAHEELGAAMVRLKGPGAVTIVSTDTNAYGSAFTDDTFLTCR